MNKITYIAAALLGGVLSLSCTKDIDETPYYAALEPYAGDYYISAFEWLGGSGQPAVVSIYEEGEAGTDLLSQICALLPKYKLHGARISVEYGKRRSSVSIYLPLLHYWSDLSLEIKQKEIEFNARLDLDKELVWEGFDSFPYPHTNEEKTCRDGDVTEFSPDSFTFEIQHYLLYDYASNLFCDGAVKMEFRKKED